MLGFLAGEDIASVTRQGLDYWSGKELRDAFLAAHIPLLDTAGGDSSRTRSNSLRQGMGIELTSLLGVPRASGLEQRCHRAAWRTPLEKRKGDNDPGRRPPQER